MKKSYRIFDIETDGLLDEVSKIHCLSYRDYSDKEISEIKTVTDYTEIFNLFKDDVVWVGHNIIRYDLIVLEKLLGLSLEGIQTVDTLGLSWYLYNDRLLHGLESWGEDFGVPKPKVEDWKNLSIEEYINRCEEDVKINFNLFLIQMEYLYHLYDSDEKGINSLIKYVNFKMDCLKDQEELGIPLDIETTKKNLQLITEEFDSRTKALSNAMPKSLGKIVRKKPKQMFRKDGTLSALGESWIDYLERNNLPTDSEEIREEPNPGSPVQIKEWLDILGWVPQLYKTSKNTGLDVPQVSLPWGQGLCPSVKDLYSIEPELENLDGYYRARHRRGILESFLEMERDGKVYSKAHGLTNTLRLTHSRPIVNLPKVSVFFGKEIRECLTVPNKNYEMVGCDISSLEDNTKQHYIYYYDPKYVEEMRVPGFDPHLEIGVLASIITEQEAEFYKEAKKMDSLTKEEEERYKSIDTKRDTSKTANFACTYGAGGAKVAETAKIPIEDGYKLHEVYWERNKAVKQFADDAKTRLIRYSYPILARKHTGIINEDGKREYVMVPRIITKTQQWVRNPISGFWIFLKEEKDTFSTINQNSGVFFFDTFLQYVREELSKYNIKVIFQYHDELMIIFPKFLRKNIENILNLAIQKTNDKLKLNVYIGISMDFGQNYAEVH